MADPREERGRRVLAVRGGAMLRLALICNLAIVVSAAIGATRPGRGPLKPMKVDPNTAPAAALESLPMIGPVLANRIVEAREAAPFRDLDDLDRRVKGIGPATIRALGPRVAFAGKPAP